MKLAEIIGKASEILHSGRDGRLIEAATWVLDKMVKDKPKSMDLNDETAGQYLLQFVTKLLEEGYFFEAARLLWVPAAFTPEPRSVRRIWEELPRQSELLIIGGGSLGKSYSVAVWLLLDWLRDPTATCIKVVSVTQEHAKRNVFAHIKNLHTNASITLPGDRLEGSIQVGEDERQGIHLVSIPSGQEGKGRLRGFHPEPRQVAHKQFGVLTRVRAIIDEAEDVPEGVWEDIDNMLITKSDAEHVKVIGAANPKDRNSKFGQRCEPKDGGWPTVDMETSEEWTGRLGWKVLRLDGARCENVEQKRMVFDGFLSWEGYQRYLALGDQSPEYSSQARGWFPIMGLHVNVIPADFVENAKGTFLFQGKSTFCASADLAFEGGDRAPFTVGRWGMVTGWKKADGTVIRFEKPRYGLQVDTQFDLQKTDTLKMAKQIMGHCKTMSIPPAWLVVDRTGNGTGVFDALCTMFGEEVMGINYGEAATDKRVLADDSRKADELYDGIVTELFFSTRKFLEFDYLKFGASLRMERLTPQLTGRRYKQSTQGRVRVEPKKEYKARGNDSPDEADSLTQLVQLVRTRGEFTAAMIVSNVERLEERKATVVDSLEFMSFDDK